MGTEGETNPGDMDFQAPVEGVENGQSPELKVLRKPTGKEKTGERELLYKEHLDTLAEPIVSLFAENLKGKGGAHEIMSAIIKGETVEIPVKFDDGSEDVFTANREAIGEALKRTGDTSEGQRAIEILNKALDKRIQEWSEKLDKGSKNTPDKVDNTFPELQALMETAGHGDEVREKITTFVEKYRGNNR